MSKHKIAKQIKRLMTTNGFKIIRQTNHYVWQNADGTGDFDCEDYVSEWSDWEGVNMEILLDIHQSCVINKQIHAYSLTLDGI